MIVKNEAHVIARCLRSIKHLLDSWCIVDTGSTDDTCEVIRRELRGLPGALHQEPWVNFGYNRSEAYYLARRLGPSSYMLLIDADEVYVGEASLPSDRDVFLGNFDSGGRKFNRPFLIKSTLDAVWTGRIHEQLRIFQPFSLGTCGSIICYTDGGRHFEQGQRERDAFLMAQEVAEDPSNVGKVFHFAQTLHLAGLFDQAIDCYRMVARRGSPKDAEFSLTQLAALTGSPR